MSNDGNKKPVTYHIRINRQNYDWPEPTITGGQIKQLAGSAADWIVNQKVKGPGEDPEIGNDQMVDLTVPGVEQFTTRAPSTEFGCHAAGI
ncbi:multiubiquitin domain-containing protein [Sinorhizobium saheli]|uniref:multiubiquitin domain-containing protein n=1 Tax=Sinorhizobium saheli TaxID=36856 RepID=UPI0018659C7A|nr:multiubiquitin domain-containing protein [Sinorhizobium saheli]